MCVPHLTAPRLHHSLALIVESKVVGKLDAIHLRGQLESVSIHHWQAQKSK
jgi:hypothetical protein